MRINEMIFEQILSTYSLWKHMETSLENLHVDIGTKRVNTSSHPGNEDPTLASEKCSFEHHQEGILHLFKPDWIGLWKTKLLQSFVSISQICFHSAEHLPFETTA